MLSAWQFACDYMRVTAAGLLRLPDLNLSSNGLKDEGAKFMAEVIKHNSILTKLDLSHNGIGDQGIKGKYKPSRSLHRSVCVPPIEQKQLRC